jgi:hypothetical protein
MTEASEMVRALMYALLLTVSGCTYIGPARLHAERTRYNVAIQESSEEQLLLNLVRLKYEDGPFFVDVNSISTQATFGSTGSVTGFLPELANKTLNIFGQGNLSDQPTITYAPVQADIFVKRVLEPITLENIVLLANSGWRIDAVLKLCLQRINNIKNAPAASGPTPEMAPEFEDFVKAAELLRQLQLDDKVHLGYITEGDKRLPVLRFSATARFSMAFLEFAGLLKLDADQLEYRLTPDIANTEPKFLSFAPRSFLGVMFYLAQAVQPPEADVNAGRITITRDASGAVFDWSRMLNGVLKIRNADARPDNTAVAVNYRDHWFFIDDSDVTSKSSFALLAHLLALQAGKTEGAAAPVLTLPLGR